MNNLLVTLFIALNLIAFSVEAEQPLPPTIEALSPIDSRYLDNQRDRVEQLFVQYFAKNIRGDDSDLTTLQQLIDRRIVRRDDTLMNQALGIILGDRLAARLNMKWVTYSDAYGRSRALQLGHSEYFLFPVTMVSRRTDAGITPRIDTLYNNAIKIMQPKIDQNPYYKPVY